MVKSYRNIWSVYPDDKLKKEVEKLAEEHKRSINNEIIYLIEKGLSKREDK